MSVLTLYMNRITRLAIAIVRVIHKMAGIPTYRQIIQQLNTGIKSGELYYTKLPSKQYLVLCHAGLLTAD